MLFEYAKEEFRQGFGFNYAGDASQPSDKHGKVKGIAELFQTKRHPPPDQDVENWLNAEVLQ